MKDVTAVILAAGEGTRMKSNLPKVIHSILGKPMAQYAIDAVQPISDRKPILIVGHQADAVKEALGGQVRFVHQQEQLGTAHAVQQAQNAAGNSALILVSYADMPLVRAETLTQLVESQKKHQGPLTMLTVEVEDPRGFGRVIRDDSGNVQAIVEEVDATEEQRQIKELNAGMYCFTADWLWENIPAIELSAKGEYYLTDLVQIAVRGGDTVQAVRVSDADELIGVNNRTHLAQATKVLQSKINRRWMLQGVTIMDPDTTYIEPGVTIGKDAVLLPNTHLQGNTAVGQETTIGPNTTIRDAQIGDRCVIEASTVESSVVEDEVDIGPYSHLRKGAYLERGVHIGNYGEVKASRLGEGTKMGHFSYLGDAQVGKGVNIGAGTITCNYDGIEKHVTKIGNHVFIGSDTMLVAPVELGEGSRTGAGSVVTKDIPARTLAVGVPARVIKDLTQAMDRGEEG